MILIWFYKIKLKTKRYTDTLWNWDWDLYKRDFFVVKLHVLIFLLLRYWFFDT